MSVQIVPVSRLCAGNARWLFAAILLVVAGCDPSDSLSTSATSETWEVIRKDSATVGYGHRKQQEVVEGEHRLIRTESTTRMSASRYGDATHVEVRVESVETPDGRLVRCKSPAWPGAAPAEIVGRVQGDELILTTTTAQGSSSTSRIPWSDEFRGYFGVEDSLARQPMQVGQRRTLKVLIPMLHRIADVELTASEIESTETLDGQEQFLRIEESARLPGTPPIRTTRWVDTAGRTVKSLDSTTGFVGLKATRELALKAAEAAPLDMGASQEVRLDRKLPRSGGIKMARYRVELADDDPAMVFPQSSRQEVTSISNRTAEITIRADAKAGAVASEAAPAVADLAASSLVQSDAPQIQTIAKEAAAGAKDEWEVARLLRRSVKKTIRETNFSQAMSSALEVAESRSGDCTEHAVLLVALLRARGIPARAAMGLVYVDARQSFGFHMWTEAYVGGKWTPLDATLTDDAVGVGHLKLGHSSLNDADALLSFLPVARVMGKLKISLIAAE